MIDLAAMITAVRIAGNVAPASDRPALRAALRLLEALADRAFIGDALHDAIYTIWWDSKIDKSTADLRRRRADAFLAALLARAEGGKPERRDG